MTPIRKNSYRLFLLLTPYLPALIWATCILLGSSDHLSAQQTEGTLERVLSFLNWQWSSYNLALGHFFARKMVHVLAYGIQGGLCFYALWRSEFKEKKYFNLFLYALGVTGLIAGWDEWHQSLLLHRSGSIHDVALDLLGASLFVLLTIRALKNREILPRHCD